MCVLCQLIGVQFEWRLLIFCGLLFMLLTSMRVILNWSCTLPGRRALNMGVCLYRVAGLFMLLSWLSGWLGLLRRLISVVSVSLVLLLLRSWAGSLLVDFTLLSPLLMRIGELPLSFVSMSSWFNRSCSLAARSKLALYWLEWCNSPDSWFVFLSVSTRCPSISRSWILILASCISSIVLCPGSACSSLISGTTNFCSSLLVFTRLWLLSFKELSFLSTGV